MVIRFEDEIRDDYLKKMPSDLSPALLPILEEVITLSTKWDEFKKLYTVSNERIELLNKVAQSFFNTIHFIIIEDIILHLARLLDKRTTMGKDNLTLQTLLIIESIKKDSPAILTELEDFLKSKEIEFIKDWRNRILSHTDYYLAVDIEKAKPLEIINRKKVEYAISSLQNITRKILIHFIDVEQFFVPTKMGDADDLIFYLNYAICQEEKRKQRLIAGKPLPEDLEPIPTI